MTPTQRMPGGEEQARSRRNAWLGLDEAALLKESHQERYQPSRPVRAGGGTRSRRPSACTTGQAASWPRQRWLRQDT